jgi:metallophosphoesterase (TIGR00282 family)
VSIVTILFVADICGRPGRQAAAHLIKPLREEHAADLVIANVENAAGGFGITPEMSKKFFSYGVDVQTSGNHIWDRVDILKYLETRPKLLRPANYPLGVPGLGSYIETVNDIRIGVLSLMGRVFMANIDCPFRVADRELSRLGKNCDVIFVDFHAEATSEKQAMCFYLNGRVSAIVGTHTHVQTADEQITSKGTAYITDAGMTGPFDSIIGMEKGPSLGRLLTGMPKRFTTASEDVRLNGVVIKVDTDSGQAESIERLSVEFDLEQFQKSGIINVDE